MGRRGPVPKRSSERRRRNKESKPTTVAVPVRSIGAVDPDALAAQMTKPELLKLAKAEGVAVSKSATKAVIAEAIAAKGGIPPAADHWHPIAHDWYRSLEESGQSEFYEPSDWQAARYVAELMSKQLKQGKPSAHMFAAVWAAMGDLLTTEASRRRVRIEIERESGDEEQSAKVTAISDYRQRLGA